MAARMPWPEWDVIWAAVEKGGSEWEAVIQHFGCDNQDDLAERVRFAIRPPARHRPHAYSKDDLEKLQNALKPATPLPLDALRRATDQFAAFVGAQVRLTPKLTRTERLDALWKKVINPAGTLEQSLRDEEILKDLFAGEALQDLDLEGLRTSLDRLRERATSHARQIEAQKRSGKQWHSDLCQLHVYMAALMAEFINPNFDVSRGKAFLTVVYTLATPIFPRGTEFKNAIRDHAES